MSSAKYIPPFRRNLQQQQQQQQQSSFEANASTTALKLPDSTSTQSQGPPEEPLSFPISLENLEIKCKPRHTSSSSAEDANPRPYFNVDLRVAATFPENFFNWVQSLRPHFDEVEARLVSSQLELFPLTSQQIQSELKYRPFFIISNRLIDAFCHLVMKQPGKAMELIKETENSFIAPAQAQNLIHPEHAQGFRYLSQGLVAYQLSLEKNQQALAQLLETYKDQKLSQGAMVVIKGARAFFSWSTWGDANGQIEELQKLCDEYPDLSNCQWRLLLNPSLRASRLFLIDKWAAPFLHEWRNLVKCIEVNPKHVLVKLAVAIFIGDHLARREGWKPGKGELRLGEKLAFRSEEDVKQYVHGTARELLEKFSHPEKVLQDLNELFTKLLPEPLRDLELGKECLLRSLQNHPEGSKANHRLAIFLYLHERNFSEGLAYARKALEKDSCNFPALMDTIQLMMGDPLGNQEELDKLFKEQCSNSTWGDVKLAEIFIIEAVFSFMIRTPQRCLDSLSTAFRLEVSSLKYLKRLPAHILRYGWDRAKIEPSRMRDFLAKFMEKRGFQDKLFKCLECALINLDIAVDREVRASGNGEGGSNCDSVTKLASRPGAVGPARDKLRHRSGERQLAADADKDWRATADVNQGQGDKASCSGFLRGKENCGEGKSSSFDTGKTGESRHPKRRTSETEENWR